MRTFSFEKLNVWQKSKELAKDIYVITNLFPNEEKFGLTSQMRRCAVSISSNIPEGSGRHSYKDKARFIEIAYGSALELLNQLMISKDLEFIDDENYRQIREIISEITAMLDGLYNSQKKHFKN